MKSATDDFQTSRWRDAWKARTLADSIPIDSDRLAEDRLDDDNDLVWRAVRGELPRAERRQLIDRLHREPDLALSWRLARELSRAADGVAEADDDSVDDTADGAPPSPIVRFPDRRQRRWTAALAIAAGLFFAVIGLQVVDWGVDPDAPPATHRGADSQIEATSDGTLSPDRATLRWRGPEGARYTVTVMTETLETVTTASDLDQAELALSDEILASLGDGTTLLWQVEARLTNGETIVSETFQARWQSAPPQIE